MKTYKDIPGWFDFERAYLILSMIPNAERIVEVGSWLGKSTVFMAQQLQAREKATGRRPEFYAVDTWEGTPGTDSAVEAAKYGGSVYEAFCANLGAAEVRDVVIPVLGTSDRAALRFLHETVDAVFIDGDHEYGAVKHDIESWWPKVKRDGFFGGHDFSKHFLNGVVKAGLEFTNGHRDFQVIGSSWLMRKEA